jgi:hypothetical protein
VKMTGFARIHIVRQLILKSNNVWWLIISCISSPIRLSYLIVQTWALVLFYKHTNKTSCFFMYIMNRKYR